MAYVAATIAAKTRYGDGPAYASPRARRSIAWLPAPAIRPMARSVGPTKKTSSARRRRARRRS